MPVKWKIFFALNIILSLPAFALFIFMLVTFSENKNTNFNIFSFLAELILLTISINGLFNIFLLQRFFPDKLMTQTVKALNTLFLVLTGLSAIGILILCIYGAKEEFDNDRVIKDDGGKEILLLLTLSLIIQVYIFILQIQLPRLIARNHRQKMNSLIDSIGQ